MSPSVSHLFLISVSFNSLPQFHPLSHPLSFPLPYHCLSLSLFASFLFSSPSLQSHGSVRFKLDELLSSSVDLLKEFELRRKKARTDPRPDSRSDSRPELAEMEAAAVEEEAAVMIKVRDGD